MIDVPEDFAQFQASNLLLHVSYRKVGRIRFITAMKQFDCIFLGVCV